MALCCPCPSSDPDAGLTDRTLKSACRPQVVWRLAKAVTLLCIVATLISIAVYVSSITVTEKSAPVPQPQTGYQYQLASQQQSANELLPHYLPGVGFAFKGYDSLQGFPLAEGHDPGFVLPIFTDDYSGGQHTEDFQYLVPKGLVATVSDSCQLHFSTDIIQTRSELYKKLKVNTRFEINLLRILPIFSASVGFKELSSEIRNSKSVFAMSSALCQYYLIQLLEDKPPPFHPVFLQWLERLKAMDDQDYIRFFRNFGTHFPTHMTLGAKYIYRFTMTSEYYRKETERQVDVASSASILARMLAVNVEASYSQNTRQVAESFMQSVRTTTVTIGAAPPPDGNVLTWASQVQQNPAPVSMVLAPVSKLFFPQFMAAYLTESEINSIRRKLQEMERVYCQTLKGQGQLDTCAQLLTTVTLRQSELRGGQPLEKHPVETIDQCIDECNKRPDCVAVDYCRDCSASDLKFQTCQMYKEEAGRARVDHGLPNEKWEAVILVEKVRRITLANTTIVGTERALDDPYNATSLNICTQLCQRDLHCVAFTFTDSRLYDIRCRLFGDDPMQLEADITSTAYFIPPRDSD